MELEKQI